MATIAKPLITVSIVLAVLAGAGLLSTVSHLLNGTEVYGLIAAIAGGTAVAGGLALPSANETPTQMVPHLVLILSVIALTVCLGLNKVFTGAEVIGIFNFIIGGGTIGAGTVIFSSRLQALNGGPVRSSGRRGLHSKGASSDFVDTTSFKEP